MIISRTPYYGVYENFAACNVGCYMYWKHRTAPVRFRCVNHKLAFEQGRILRSDRQVRFCKYCLNLGKNLIEDEHHVLLICPLFIDIRQRYIARHFRHFLASDISFVYMMPNKSEIAIT